MLFVCGCMRAGLFDCVVAWLLVRLLVCFVCVCVGELVCLCVLCVVLCVVCCVLIVVC